MTDTTLATRCPQCQTRFRVTSLQLALREGAVRCGACRHVFDGRKESGATRPVGAAGQPDEMAEGTAANHATVPALMDLNAERISPATGNSTVAAGLDMQQELDALSSALQALQDLQASPQLAPLEADFTEGDWDGEPGFMQDARKKRRTARAWKILLGLGIPLLIVALAAQLTYHFRSEISVRIPIAAPILKAACEKLGCTINLPTQIDALSLQSSQLQAVPGEPGKFELAALVRNQSATVQAWPAFDLLLKDEAGQAQVRKVLLPASLLPPQKLARGLEARSEHEVRMHFSMTNAQAADFQLTLFYP